MVRQQIDSGCSTKSAAPSIETHRAVHSVNRLVANLLFGLALLLWLWPVNGQAQTCSQDCVTQYYACLGGGWPGLGPIATCLGELNDCTAACPNNPPPPGAVPDGGPQCSDPVDCGSGLFVYDHDDLTLPDVIPITLGRTYRETDTTTTAFGIGMANVYDISVVADAGGSYTYADLILPDAGRVHYVRTSSGSSYIDAVFQPGHTPSEFKGSTITWGIANHGWLLRLRDGTQLKFGALSLLDSIQDRNGNTVTITRNSSQKIQAIISPNGRWFYFTLDSDGRITQALDNSGRTVSYSYNSNGQLESYTDANNHTTTYGYDGSGHLTTITTPRNYTRVTNQYDGNGRVTQQTHADGGVFSFSYTLNGSGAVTSSGMTDARGNSHQFDFNSDGFVTNETWAVGDPEQQTVTFTRSGNDLVASMTDQLGRETAYTYDANDNLASVTQLDGTPQAVTTSATYDPAYSQLTSLTDPLSHTWTLGHDGNGNLTSVTDPLSNEVTASYNSEGQIISLTNAAGTFQFGYTGGDLASITDPLGNVTTRFTDSVGRLLSVTDPLGHSTSYSYDAMNNLTGISDPLGDTTTLAYDADDDLASVSDPRSNTTSYTYDSMDRRASRTDPLSASASYTWDGNSNLTQATDRNGNLTQYTYDALNRPTQIGFGYSGGSYQSTVGLTWDGGNRLTQAVDSIAGTIVRSYDGLDNLTDEQSPQGEVTYGYDAASRRTSMQVAGQGAVGYSWDNADRLTTITQGSASVSLGYDGANRRTTLTLPNGVTVSYAYDNASHLTQLSYGTGGAGSTDVGTLTYSYDTAGHVINKAGTLAATTVPSAVSGNSFNADNAMTGFNGQSLSYDANGNLTYDGTNTYSWDARNHLTGISGGVSASFVYDPFGRRAEKVIGGTTTQFLYDGLNPLQELDSASPPNATANLLTGLNIDEYFTRADASGTATFLSDALGSTIGLTNSSGAIATSYTYDPFGNVTAGGSASANPYQFTGRENDGTSLYYYRARYYSPTFQRFASQDPIGFAGGGTNLYGYVWNDPADLIDPFGLWTIFLGGTISYTENGLTVSGALGLVVDGEGNIGVALTSGIGSMAYGGDLSSGGLLEVSKNAKNICDLQGPFANFGASAEGAGGEYFSGTSPDGPVNGFGFSWGPGIGAGGGYSVTSTAILPLISLRPFLGLLGVP